MWYQNPNRFKSHENTHARPAVASTCPVSTSSTTATQPIGVSTVVYRSTFSSAQLMSIDDVTPECESSAYQSCWIEAGFIASRYYTQGFPRIFVASVTPSGGFSIYPYTATVYPLDSLTTFSISTPTYGNQNYTVDIDNDQYNLYFTVPFTVPMRPSRISMGQELAGSAGSSSQQMDLIWNMYGGNQGTFYYQSNNGILSGPPRNPPSGNWESPPSQGQYAGGWFYTYCC